MKLGSKKKKKSWNDLKIIKSNHWILELKQNVDVRCCIHRSKAEMVRMTQENEDPKLHSLVEILNYIYQHGERKLAGSIIQFRLRNEHLLM